MLPVLIPLSQQIVDWQSFLTFLRDTTGLEPAKRLDELKIKVGDHASYLETLICLVHGLGVHPQQILRRGDSAIFKHLMFSFAAYHDEENLLQPILVNSELDAIGKDGAVVITGSLDKWSAAVHEFCTVEHTFNIRLIFNKVLLHFEQAGLEEIWNDYAKQRLEDKTFILRRKR